MMGIVPMILPFHILSGVLALVFGYVALYAAKGAALHRKSGLLFVFAMVTLSLTGALVAFLSASSISVVAGLLTFWRMCFAMWVAAASFFFGPPGRVPEAIRIPALLPIPVLVPVVVMLFWLWRIRVRKTLLGIVSVGTPQVSGATK